jgi:hypothetical protein
MTESSHVLEAGLGLEYRGDAGIVIGGDFRVGDRTVDTVGGAAIDPTTLCVDCTPNAGVNAGQFRSARLYAGIRF